MIYVDSCAVVKLLREEQHSAALAAHIGTSPAEMISSELTKVEVCRTMIRLRIRDRTREDTDDMLSKVARLPINAVLDIAADLDGPTLRSLDALHVATARMLGPAVTQFITYDKRLAKAATDAGLPLTMPGVN